jgi:hypothetical protein
MQQQALPCDGIHHKTLRSEKQENTCFTKYIPMVFQIPGIQYNVVDAVTKWPEAWKSNSK